jgi:RUN domain
MNQTLAERIKFLISDTDKLSEWFEPWSILCQPNLAGPIIGKSFRFQMGMAGNVDLAGMLQGLSQLEFNLFLKPDER